MLGFPVLRVRARTGASAGRTKFAFFNVVKEFLLLFQKINPLKVKMSDVNAWASIDGLFDDQDDEDSAETSQREVFGASKDNLILAIDCSPSMYRVVGEESHFQLSIKCAINIMKSKIISSDRDLIGIVFFSTKSNKGKDDTNKHIYQELDQPDAQRILDLEKLLEEHNSGRMISLTDNSCDVFENSLHDVLWTCSNMFSQSTQKSGYKRMMLFTDNDNPHSDDKQLQNLARTKARDLSEIGINIELMHILPPGGSFDPQLFYQDIISDDDEDIQLPDPSEKFDELLSRVQKKEHKKRPLASIPFTLADGVDMGISVFNLCRPATKSSTVNLNSRTNEEIKTHTKYICKDTGSELMPTDIKYYQMFGGEKVIFEKEEVAAMKNFGNPGLLLMGFKPKKSLKRLYHIKSSHFIHPDEKSVSGSTTLFSALLKKSLEKEVIPICRYIPRAVSAPSFVALLPQKEEFNDHKVQITPPGFHVIFLPYVDDMRKLQYPKMPKATTEQVNKAKEIIKKLTFTFRSTDFENPSLQKHYNHLEALALDRDSPEEVDDLTEPDVERLDRRAGTLMQEFKDLVFPDGYNPDAKPATKRKAPGEGTAKKAKVEGLSVDIKEEAMKGRLSKLTVPVLKDFVRQAGIKSGTKKAELIDAINEHFGI
ncbi:X-ray repair cross-complementing protein 6-like isoform X2 [Actinia tenebrosa]|uniref:DNA helicase n=1 Tax=Actinia tenebrosa TaxID=6105 RepID=A0A6P8IYD9_ACTTE|nr:X-ray repair cross-complementing protein 6-like isoform X2 [Actinia tenebrosa]